MKIGSLCSGYGGLDMAVAQVFGAAIAWHCEYEEAPARILDHHWPQVPNHHDLTTLDWTSVEPVDLLIGGIPCQPFSDAGQRLALGDPRHLWPFMAAGVRVLRPRYVCVENVSGFVVRGGLDCVLTDLAALGYDAQWASVRASDVGAPHRRERVFILASDRVRHSDDNARGAELGRQSDVTTTGARKPGAGASSRLADAERGGRDGRAPDPQRGTLGRAAPSGTGAGCYGGQSAADPDIVGCPGVPELDPSTQAGIDGERRGHADGRSDGAHWGPYTPAITRWAATLGRPAPAPTEPGARGGQRLSPRFVEWMMGLPDGHVTDVPGISCNAQLKALGNGVVPQQAIAALTHLLSIEERWVA